MVILTASGAVGISVVLSNAFQTYIVQADGILTVCMTCSYIPGAVVAFTQLGALLLRYVYIWTQHSYRVNVSNPIMLAEE